MVLPLEDRTDISREVEDAVREEFREARDFREAKIGAYVAGALLVVGLGVYVPKIYEAIKDLF